MVFVIEFELYYGILVIAFFILLPYFSIINFNLGPGYNLSLFDVTLDCFDNRDY